jgi:hypothetical protein
VFTLGQFFVAAQGEDTLEYNGETW